MIFSEVRSFSMRLKEVKNLFFLLSFPLSPFYLSITSRYIPLSRTIGNFFTDRRRLKYLRHDERYSSGVSALPRIETNKRHSGELVAPEPRTVLRSIIHSGTNPILIAREARAFRNRDFPLLSIDSI